MSFASSIPYQAFWSQSWSAPLRAACIWLRRDPAPVVSRLPEALAPGWLRPLCVQRCIAQAIAARLAWMRQHPDLAAQRFLYPSTPDWTREAWTPYDRGWLRVWTEAWLLECFQVEVERLLRIMQTPPALLGEEVWTRVALGTCERLAQLYQELRRRSGMRAARRLVRDTLENFICWYPAREADKERSPDVTNRRRLVLYA